MHEGTSLRFYSKNFHTKSLPFQRAQKYTQNSEIYLKLKTHTYERLSNLLSIQSNYFPYHKIQKFLKNIFYNAITFFSITFYVFSISLVKALYLYQTFNCLESHFKVYVNILIGI